MSDDDDTTNGDDEREDLELEGENEGEATEGDLIRKALEKLGVSMISDIREECLAEGIWSDERIEQILNRGLNSVIRQQIKVEDEQGRPFAAFMAEAEEEEEEEGESKNRGKHWTQLDLLLPLDFDANHKQKIGLCDSILAKDHAMNKYCYRSFGHKILTPRLTTDGVSGYDEDED